MNLPFLQTIFAYITVAVISTTEANPLWKHINKRAASDAADNSIQFSNAPTTVAKKTTTTTTKKTTATAAPTTKAATTKTATTSKAANTTSAQISPASSTSASTSHATIPPLIAVPTSPSLTTPTGASASTSPTSAKSSDKKDGGISGGAIGGIVAAVVIIIAGIAAYLILRKRSKNKRNVNSRLSKPDPFTMGFGNDKPYQPQMQQTNLQVETAPSYQHQYGTQTNAAMTSPTTLHSPTSPYYNSSSSQFHDANSHIIAGSMMPAIAVSQSNQQPYEPTQYQPQTIQQYQPAVAFPQDQHAFSETNAADRATSPIVNTPVDTAPTIRTDVGSAVATAIAPKLQPTQAGSIGVFYVTATYTPTLSDEIDIQVGDQVEVLVEYDDGWCQGINLSRGGQKGVFPKHCLDYYTPTAEPQQQALFTEMNSNEADRVKRVSSMYVA